MNFIKKLERGKYQLTKKGNALVEALEVKEDAP